MEGATLSSTERAKLADFLLSTLAKHGDTEVESLWDQIAERRAEGLQTDRLKGIPLDRFLQDLRERFP